MGISEAIRAAAGLIAAVDSIRALAALLTLAIVVLAYILFRKTAIPTRIRLFVFLVPIVFFGALFIQTVAVLTPNVIRLSPQSLVFASAIGPDRANVDPAELQWTQCYDPPKGYTLVHGSDQTVPGDDTNGRPRYCGRGAFGHRCKDGGWRCWNRYATSVCFVRTDWLEHYKEEQGPRYSAEEVCDQRQ